MKLKKLLIDNWILILIVLSATFFRFYKLADNPPSLNWDEVSHGYNAYSILKTGKDEWGKTFPLIFQAYGDFKLPLYIYLTAPFIFLFGLNGFSVRFVSVLSGVGLVLLSYIITGKITKNKTISLLAGVLTAFSPWSLFVSRIAVEANLGAFLFALGIYGFFCWLEKPEKKWLVWTVVGWCLSIYSYNSGRIMVPFFLVILLIFVWKKKKLKQFLVPGIILAVFLTPLVIQFLNNSGKARFNLVSIIDQGAINQIIEKRNTAKLPANISRLIFNKPIFFIYRAIGNYLLNLSPKYLFFYGGSHYQFSLPNHELLYLVTAPFMLLGLIKILTAKNNSSKVLCWWFFLSFIPSAVTKDAPHVLRTIFVLPAPMIITVIGVGAVLAFLRNKSKFGGKLLLFVLTGAVLFSFGRWWRDYWTVYPKSYSWAWQYGYAQAAFFIEENYEKYNRIFFTKRNGEPHEFLLFYLKYSPEKYQNEQNKKWDYHASWYWIDQFDKFTFINDWEVIERVKEQESKRVEGEKSLLITSPGNYPQGWNKIKTIEFLDGKPVFEILENK